MIEQAKTCRECRFFDDLEDRDAPSGNCRRYPPVLVAGHKSALAEAPGLTHFDVVGWASPVVHSNGWCGEFARC